jgi:hypothetical protein
MVEFLCFLRASRRRKKLTNGNLQFVTYSPGDGKTVSPALINQSVLEIYEGNKLSFIALSNSMTRHQWKLLTAIAIEGQVFQPTGKGFITRYQLGGSACVFRTLSYLTERELACQYSDHDNKTYYEIDDIVLMRWLQKK